VFAFIVGSPGATDFNNPDLNAHPARTSEPSTTTITPAITDTRRPRLPADPGDRLALDAIRLAASGSSGPAALITDPGRRPMPRSNSPARIGTQSQPAERTSAGETGRDHRRRNEPGGVNPRPSRSIDHLVKRLEGLTRAFGAAPAPRETQLSPRRDGKRAPAHPPPRETQAPLAAMASRPTPRQP
jgi:hypothetical protein